MEIVYLKDYSKYTDSELFQIFCENDSRKNDVFTEIYNRTSSMIYTYCYHTLGNTQDANDITQETFVRFYQHQEPFQSTNYLRSYLYTIARNLCINLLKNRKNKIQIEEDLFEYQDDFNEREEFKEIINKAIEKLPFYLQEIFILKFIQGLDYDEISKITMTNYSTLRTRAYRALEKMQQILKPIFKDDIKEKK